MSDTKASKDWAQFSKQIKLDEGDKLVAMAKVEPDEDDGKDATAPPADSSPPAPSEPSDNPDNGNSPT